MRQSLARWRQHIGKSPPSAAASRYPAALQPSPFNPEIAVSYARRSTLFNEVATRATVSTTKTEWATSVRSLGRLELAFGQVLQTLAYARTRPIRHVFDVADDALQPLAILAPRAQLAYRAPDPSQALVLDQRRLGARQGRQRATPHPQPDSRLGDPQILRPLRHRASPSRIRRGPLELRAHRHQPLRELP